MTRYLRRKLARQLFDKGFRKGGFALLVLVLGGMDIMFFTSTWPVAVHVAGYSIAVSLLVGLQFLIIQFEKLLHNGRYQHLALLPVTLPGSLAIGLIYWPEWKSAAIVIASVFLFVVTPIFSKIAVSDNKSAADEHHP